MPNRLSIACTLDARDFASRDALMAELARDALLDLIQDGPHAVLRFAAGSGVQDRVESFVAGESACCAFLHIELAQIGDEIELHIDAPAEAELALSEMLAAFQPHDRRRPSPARPTGPVTRLAGD